jgi:hypothetical protein
MGRLEMGRFGIGRLGDWEIGRLGDWEIDSGFHSRGIVTSLSVDTAGPMRL